jgi:hypothetical protein
VYAGCLRERLITPVLPSVAWQPFEGLRSRARSRSRTGPPAALQPLDGLDPAGRDGVE